MKLYKTIQIHVNILLTNICQTQELDNFLYLNIENIRRIMGLTIGFYGRPIPKLYQITIGIMILGKNKYVK